MVQDATGSGREAALAKLDQQVAAQQQRVREAADAGLAALDGRAVAAAQVEQHDAAVGVAVRALTAEGLDPDQLIDQLASRVTAEEIRRHLAVDAVSRQQAIEADRVPYGDRPVPEDGDLAWDQMG